MPAFKLQRKISVSSENAWKFLGNFAQSPGPEIEVKVESEGDSANNGVGMIRTIKIGGATIREVLESCDPPRSFSYRILNGVPVKEYVGIATFEDVDGATLITWSAEFTPRFPIPGFVLNKALKSGVNKLIDTLEKNHG